MKKSLFSTQSQIEKNDGVWYKENPHDFVQTNDRNGQKIMIFVAIVDSQISIVHAFDKSQTVNGACYLALLKEVVWPALRYEEKLLVDARWRPSSLHQFGKRLSLSSRTE